MSHPLLDQLEHVLRLLAMVKDMPQDEYSPELEKYLDGQITYEEKMAMQAGPRGVGKLNPTWVEWLMGFPIGWTDLGASETQ